MTDEPSGTAGGPTGTGLLRERIKARWPGVLLTLTSIIQALALETLWSELSEEPFALMAPLQIWIVALQGLAVLLAIVVLWLFYAQLVMRFDWVPGLRDSVGPFTLGLLEFALAETIGMDLVGIWIGAFAVPVLIAHLITLSTFSRARSEPENAAFFESVRIASAHGWQRHLAQLGTAAGMLLLGASVYLSGDAPAVVLGALIGLCALLGVQLWLQRVYWYLTINR